MAEASGFDLDRYLARIGLERAPRPDADGLAELQRAHLCSIPFENLDVMLGRSVRLDPDALMAKLVERRRGGYCFEMNSLFHLALQACGFEARPLLARVLVGRARDDPGPKTHCLLLVNVDGQTWIADVGFGLGLPGAPIPLEEGVEHDQLDTRLRIRHDAELGWVLQRTQADGWADLYAFGLERVYPSDLVAAHHFTSTFPDSPFLRIVFLSRVLPDGGRLSILGDRGALYRRDETEEEVPPAGADRLEWLKRRFGIELDVSPDALPPWPPLEMSG